MVVAELSASEIDAMTTVGVTALVVIGAILLIMAIADAFEYWVRHKYPIEDCDTPMWSMSYTEPDEDLEKEED